MRVRLQHHQPRFQRGILATLPKLQRHTQVTPLGAGAPFAIVNQRSEYLRVNELLDDRRTGTSAREGTKGTRPSSASLMQTRIDCGR